MTANPYLLVKQGINEEDEIKINDLHQIRYDLHLALHNMDVYKYNHLAREIVKLLYDIEAELQRLWKFEVNVDYYKFWNVPGCRCSVLDNEDAYPSGYYTINLDCPLHGEEKHMFLRGK